MHPRLTFEFIMNQELKVLIVEDVATDAELVERELRKAGIAFVSRRVETEADLRRELHEFAPDIILSDYTLPGFGGALALAITRKERPEVPFVFVSGSIGEEKATEAVKSGARDYVLKNNLIRLPHAVQRALQEAIERTARERAEKALRQSEAKNRLLAMAVEQSQDAILAKDLNGVVMTWNKGAEKLYGFTAEEAIGKSMRELQMSGLSDDEWERVLTRIRSGRLVSYEARRWTKSGEIIETSTTASPMFDEQGNHIGEIGIAHDITEHKRQEEKIARLSRIHAVLSGINSAIVRIRDRQELFEEACRIAVEHGKFPIAWIGLVEPSTGEVKPVAWAGNDAEYISKFRRSIRSGVPEGRGTTGRALREKKPVYENDIAANLQGGMAREEVLRRGYHSLIALPLLVEGTGVGSLSLYAEEPGYFNDDELKLLTELADDVSFALDHIQKEEKLNYLAYYNAVTGLPNHELFYDRLNQRVNAAKHDQKILAVAACDLERFRIINDTLGRHVGDELLKLVAERLKNVIQDPDILGHPGADCFAMVFRDVKEEADIVHRLQQTVIGCLDQPFILDGKELRISARAGIALFPNDGNDADTLFKNAEAALKKAKSSADKYVFYAPQMNARVSEQLALENKLRRALEEEQFVLYYQPQVDLASGRIAGLEGLIRWNDPEAGLVPPFKFIPILEETGMILDVGKWVIERAVNDHLHWLEKGIKPPRVSVNISQLQLRQKDFVGVVGQAIKGYRNWACGLDLEITESLIMEDIETNIGKLKAVRKMGVGIAIDDFGTGYSSLAYIAKLPVNVLKIDRAFIQNLAANPDDMTIVSTMITLAHSLNLKVVAEGVETQEQANLLKLLKCDEMQGYLFSPPVPLDKIEVMLVNQPEVNKKMA